jgi:uncharacterized protein (TIGR02453 family)
MKTLATQDAIFTSNTFRFFRDLEKNNSKVWMDENRERYKQHLVEPLRRLLDALAPAVQKLYAGFSVSGRTGENFSRINRDIRFAKDKTPYYNDMYLFFSRVDSEGRASGQLYVGLSAKTVTVGFRIYSGDRQSAMAAVCLPRAPENSAWLVRQRKTFARRYDSYWYTSENGNWTKRSGWPIDAREWKKAKGWIVRRKFSSSAALRPQFRHEIEKIFHELFPLYSFSCLPKWKR